MKVLKYLSIILVLALSGCGVTSSDGFETRPTDTPTETTVPEPVLEPTASPSPIATPEPTKAAETRLKCKDGTFSTSTGRGACSHHGGVAK